MTDGTTHHGVMITFSTPAEGASDREFNDWYDKTHVPEILAHVDGVVAVRRYRLSPKRSPLAGDAPAPYVAMYELDRPVDEVLKSFGAAAATMTRSDTLGEGDRAPISLMYELLSSQP